MEIHRIFCYLSWGLLFAARVRTTQERIHYSRRTAAVNGSRCLAYQAAPVRARAPTATAPAMALATTPRLGREEPTVSSDVPSPSTSRLTAKPPPGPAVGRTRTMSTARTPPATRCRQERNAEPTACLILLLDLATGAMPLPMRPATAHYSSGVKAVKVCGWLLAPHALLARQPPPRVPCRAAHGEDSDSHSARDAASYESCV